MKRIRLVLLLALMGMGSSAWACDYSQLLLSQIEFFPPTEVRVTVKLYLGGGRTGLVTGAGDATRELFFGVYNSEGPLNVLSYYPNHFIEGYTSCRMDLWDLGPLPWHPWNTQATLYGQVDATTYPDCADGYSCIHSTADCGNVHESLIWLQMAFDGLPDSIRVFGVEGNGVPVFGCYPDLDMMVDIANLAMRTQQQTATYLPGQGVEVMWSGMFPQEDGTAHLERKAPGDAAWQTLESWHTAQGSAITLSHLDAQPLAGMSEYRIRHVAQGGVTQTYLPMPVEVDSPVAQILPNPVSGAALLVTGLAEPAPGSVEVHAVDGKLLHHLEGMIQPTHHVDLSALPAGVYQVSVALADTRKTWLRVVKQ